jgi:hypothetical protein
MDRRQRVAAQRAMVREAIGKLRAAEELFGVEDRAVGDDGFREFSEKVSAFERWVFDESGIA